MKKIIKNKKIDVFFEKYPKEKELPSPRVIEVRDSEIDIWGKRVVFAFKKNTAICWLLAKTLEVYNSRLNFDNF